MIWAGLTQPLLAQIVFDAYRQFILWLVCWIVPAAAITGVLYLLISLPQRRRERARFFFDLLWVGLRTGRTPEETILSAARTQDRAPGVRFHLLAAYLEQGMRLGTALDKVPRLVPATLRGLLQAGEQAGRLPEAVNLGREFLNNAPMRESIGYPAIVLLVYVPLQLVVLGVQQIYVVPKFKEILLDFEIPMPPLSAFFLGRLEVGLGIFVILLLVIGLLALLFVGGPRVSQLFQPLTDWMNWRLPWQRDRLQAQFAALLGLLLDAGVPESEAVLTAARSTYNRVWLRRAEKVVRRLSSGTKLTEALESLDKTGELRWRVANAAAGARGGFWSSLRGWQEALQLRAQHQAQSALTWTTSALILVNGLMIGLMAASVFLVFIEMINGAALW